MRRSRRSTNASFRFARRRVAQPYVLRCAEVIAAYQGNVRFVQCHISEGIAVGNRSAVQICAQHAGNTWECVEGALWDIGQMKAREPAHALHNQFPASTELLDHPPMRILWPGQSLDSSHLGNRIRVAAVLTLQAAAVEITSLGPAANPMRHPVIA